MNLTSYTEVNGKKLTKAQLNLLAKLENDYELVIDRIEVCNPLSGATRTVHPVIAALVVFVQYAYRAYELRADGSMAFNGKKVSIGLFDRVRMAVLNLDAATYSSVLD
jgi:hypothetical protein